MTLALVTYPNKALTTTCEPVPPEWFVGEASTVFLKQIVEIANICHRNKGFALAANQVGMSYRFIVILPSSQLSASMTADDGRPILTPSVIVNPQVLRMDDNKALIKEGCLSFPKLLLPITRPTDIELAWTDNVGKPYKGLVTGMLSRVIQHEIDHLDGIQFIDRLSPFAREKHQHAINKLRRR